MVNFFCEKTCVLSLQDYTFVRKLYKNILSMISEIPLTGQQIDDLRIALRGRKAMEMLATRCYEKRICSRATTFKALNPVRYDSNSAIHRLAVNEAVIFLREEFKVTFPWAELEPAEA